MAAYGSIGICRSVDAATTTGPKTPTGLVKVATVGMRRMFGQLQDTMTSGSTALNSVANPNRWVRIYDRVTGKLIRSERSDASGNFVIRGVPVATDAYFGVLDQQSGDAGSYNAHVLDHLSQT